MKGETVQVYVTQDCWSCQESHRIIERVQRERSDIEMIAVDVTSDVPPEFVFAVPTYAIGATVLFLGNPTAGELIAKVDGFGKGQQEANDG